MKPHINGSWKSSDKYMVCFNKAFICDMMNWECHFCREDKRILPKKRKEIIAGLYLVQFDSYYEYLSCITEMYINKMGFVCLEDEYDDFKDYYSPRFNKAHGADIPMYVEAHKEFNDYYYNTRNTITIRVQRTNYFYNEILYPVPENFSQRKSPSYYAEEFLSRQGSDYDYARYFMKTVKESIEEWCNITTPLREIVSLCEILVKENQDAGYPLCSYKIRYLDGTKDSYCYGMTPMDIIKHIDRLHSEKIMGIAVQLRCCEYPQVGRIYIVYMNDGRKFKYLHKSMDEFNKHFQVFIRKGFNMRVERM